MMTQPNWSPAEVYERSFVPALFGPWGERLAALTEARADEEVLDVACGTGALTRALAARVGPHGRVVGLDVAEAMLEVARRLDEPIEWRLGNAEALPFEDARFDVVASQFGFMFFEDRGCALAEMMRVLRPGGRLVVAVCDAVDRSAGYAVLIELLHRLFGESVAEAFRAPFRAGDRDALAALCRDAFVEPARIERHEGEVRFESIEALVATERACAWTLGGLLDEQQFARLRHEADESLRPFVGTDGRLVFGMPALVITARRGG